MRRWFVEACPRLATRLATRVQARMIELRHADDGDVPGWVMVTLMSALLVVAIFALAETQLSKVLNDALQTVLP